MAMTQTLGGVLEDERQVFVSMAQNGDATLLTIGPVGQVDGRFLERLRKAVTNGCGNGESCVIQQDLALVFGNAQESRVLPAHEVGNVNRRNQLPGMVRHALLRVVQGEKLAIRIRQAQQRFDAFEEHAVLVLEDPQIGSDVVQALGKNQERIHGVALVVGALGVIPVR